MANMFTPPKKMGPKSNKKTGPGKDKKTPENGKKPGEKPSEET